MHYEKAALSGVLDINRVSDLHEFALQLVETGADVEIDAAEIERIDTSVVQILLALRNALQRRGCKLVFSSISTSVREFLRTVGVVEELQLKDASQ